MELQFGLRLSLVIMMGRRWKNCGGKLSGELQLTPIYMSFKIVDMLTSARMP